MKLLPSIPLTVRAPAGALIVFGRNNILQRFHPDDTGNIQRGVNLLLCLGAVSYTHLTNKDEIAAAEAELTAHKPLVLAYGKDDLRDKMINGNAALAVV